MLNNVRNPVRTLRIAAPLGLGICASLYLLANIAYFSAATKVRRLPLLSVVVLRRRTGGDQVFGCHCGSLVFQECIRNDGGASAECLCRAEVCRLVSAFPSFFCRRRLLTFSITLFDDAARWE